MGKFKDEVKAKYANLSNEEIVIKLKNELINNIKYFMALEYIIPVFDDLNNKGMSLNTNFRKVVTQECRELIYYAYLKKIIPFEVSPSKKNIKLLAESFGLLDITLDCDTFRKIVIEQFEKDMEIKKLSTIIEVSERYYEDERLELDSSDTDYLFQLNLFNEIENKRLKYFYYKDQYEEALSIIIKNYKPLRRIKRL